jgi:hypothetical protein
VVQSVEAPLAQSNELVSPEKTAEAAPPIAPPTLCVTSLPTHSLPFKKRKLSSAFLINLVLEKTPEKAMPKASQLSPEGKILQQTSYSASPSTSKVSHDDIQAS